MILVVDDEPRNRFFLAAMLKRHGYEVAQAGSGSDALKICPKTRPDVVITDLNMPELDGADLTRQIHANWPETSVILTSGYFTDKAQKVISAGLADFIYKPIELDLLLTKIKRLLLRLGARKIQSTTHNQAAVTPDEYRNLVAAKRGILHQIVLIGRRASFKTPEICRLALNSAMSVSRRASLAPVNSRHFIFRSARLSQANGYRGVSADDPGRASDSYGRPSRHF